MLHDSKEVAQLSITKQIKIYTKDQPAIKLINQEANKTTKKPVLLKMVRFWRGAVLCGRNSPTFQTDFLPPSSGTRVNLHSKDESSSNIQIAGKYF